jgi:hypothetical protein
MVSTKQFTIFFLLVVVFLVAIMIVSSFAWREAGRTYDTTGIRASLIRIVDFSAFKISEQEAAMDHWVTEVNGELVAVEGQIGFFQDRVDNTIHGLGPNPRPIP